MRAHWRRRLNQHKHDKGEFQMKQKQNNVFSFTSTVAPVGSEVRQAATAAATAAARCSTCDCGSALANRASPRPDVAIARRMTIEEIVNTNVLVF